MDTGRHSIIKSMCYKCKGLGNITVYSPANQLNGMSDVLYRKDIITCPACGGTGMISSTSSAPRGRRIE